MFDFEDPSDLSVWEVSCDPDHPVAYDFDLTDWRDILLMIVCICHWIALIVIVMAEWNVVK